MLGLIFFCKKNNKWLSKMKNEVKIGLEIQHFPKLWGLHSLIATLWYTKMIITLPRSFCHLIWMIWDILVYLKPGICAFTERRERQKHK